MSDMNLKDSWENDQQLIDYLAHQLISGRLGLFLGAGISQFYGLPNWETLIQRICQKTGEPFSPGDDLIQKAAFLRARHYASDIEAFKADVSEALYRGLNLDFAQLRQSDTLAAIGSLVMSSKRGSAAKVFTLNYDDLLENYLEFHGFTTSIIWSDRHWAHNDDVAIYHPHGFLPLAGRQCSDDIVLGSAEYHGIMQSDLWRPLLKTALRTHTFLYIGLSGTDIHLQSLLHGMTGEHAVSEERTAFHGVRFSIAGNHDDIGVILEPQGVFTHQLPDYSALPEFLFRICQSARLQRLNS